MIKITHNIDAVNKRLNHLSRGLSHFTNSFYSKNQTAIELGARNIIQNVVYDAYSPSTYKRTGRLLNSVMSSKTSDGIVIWAEANATPPETRGKRQSGFNSYSKDVLVGFSGKMSPRNRQFCEDEVRGGVLWAGLASRNFLTGGTQESSRGYSLIQHKVGWKEFFAEWIPKWMKEELQEIFNKTKGVM